ncbi:MAG: hypothetical protein M1834_009033 [Cirrosporium novae-zelandiae]|nr:MAG: hypothetical protein M1834_009033 [Cirrosporium novae-zelandiae]
MKISPTLAWKALSSKIHPPLPLNVGQSQELLAILTSSFRKELDDKHPIFRNDENPHKESPGSKAVIGSSASQTSYHPSSKASSVSTDHHFSSILTHPLFAIKPDHPHSSGRRNSLSESQKLWADPMGYFDREVAAGTATLEMAKVCLMADWKALLSSPAASVQEKLQQSPVGTRIAQWLRTSDISLEGALDDLEFLNLVLPYLTPLKHHHTILHWVKVLQFQLNRRGGNKEHANLRYLLKDPSQLVFRWVKSIWRYQDSLDIAVNSFLRIAQRLDHASDTPKICGKAGRWLTFKLTRAGQAQIEFASFQTFVRMVPAWTGNIYWTRADLALHHPTSPDPSPALERLYELEEAMEVAAMEPGHTNLTKYTSSRRMGLTWMCLETARVLLEQKRIEEATWVLHFVQKYFAAELKLDRANTTLGNNKNGTNANSPDEGFSLRLLEQLDTL